MNCSQPFSVLESPAAQNVLVAIHDFYAPAVPVVFLFLCIFSILANIIVVLILSKKTMRCSGVNNMMIVMSSCDLLCSLSAFQSALTAPNATGDSLFRVFIPMASFYLMVALHSLSINMAVGMGFCRVMSLKTDGKRSQIWQGSNYALRITFLLFLFTFSVAIPYVLLLKLKKVSDGLYTMDIVIDNGCLLLKSVFLLNGIVMKFIPVTSMIYFSVIILRNIKNNKEVRIKVHKSRANSKQMDRSSDLILAILVIFLITEIPQVIFSVFCGIFTNDYYLYAGPNIGSIFDILTLLNSASSIVIYCLLSSKFRALFLEIVTRRKQKITTIQSTTSVSVM